MADTIIDRLFIAFGVNADGVQKGMTKAESIIHKGIDSIKSVIMPLATGFALTSMVQGFVEGASQAAKASEFLSMSMEDLQAWQGAAEAMGAEGAEVNEMIMDMNEHLVDMVQFGSGPAVDVLNKLGIAAKDAGGKIRPATDILLDMAEKGEKISKQEMLAYGRIMGFDKSVIDLLMQGRKGLEDLLSAQKELAVFQKEDAEIAKKGRIAWQGFMKSLQAVQAVIMRAVMPALVSLTDWLTRAAVWVKNNQPFMIALITGLAIAISFVLLPALYKMAAATIAATWPWALLLAAIAAGAALWDDFTVYVEGGEAALGNFWKKVEEGKIFFDKLREKIMSFFTDIRDKWNEFKSFLGFKDGEMEAGKVMVDHSWFTYDDEQKNKSPVNVPAPQFALTNAEAVNAVLGGRQGTTNNTITSTSHVGSITINTQATDAAGIVKSISPALKHEFDANSLVMAANTGVIAK